MQQKNASDEGEEGCNMPSCKRFRRTGPKPPFASQSRLRSDTGCPLTASGRGSLPDLLKVARACPIFTCCVRWPLPLRDPSISGVAPPSVFHVVSSAHHALSTHPLQDMVDHNILSALRSEALPS